MSSPGPQSDWGSACLGARVFAIGHGLCSAMVCAVSHVFESMFACMSKKLESGVLPSSECVRS
eukprot:scaffold43700_cov39-Tisochrysis_lutea.AAC.1